MAALLAFVLLAGACSSASSDTSGTPTTTIAPDELSFSDGTPAGEGIGSEDYIVASEEDATNASGDSDGSDDATAEPSSAEDDGTNDEGDPDAALATTIPEDQSTPTTQAGTATTTANNDGPDAELDREVDQGFEVIVDEDDEDLDIPVNPEPGDPGRLFEDGLTPEDSDVDLTLWFDQAGVTAAPGDVVQVPLDSVVSISVVAYADDDVTVEGYGLTTFVDAGDLAIVVFRADQAGSFDIRLDGAGIDLARIVVS